MLNPSLIPLALFLAAAPAAAAMRAPQEGYRLPPQEVVDIIDAAPAPGVQFSPDKRWMLLVESSSLPSSEDVSRRMLRLAGMRIDPVGYSSYRTSFNEGLLLRSLDETEAIRIPLPEGARLSGVSWSHNSRLFAFWIAGEGGSQLYAATVAEPISDRFRNTGVKAGTAKRP